MMNGLFTENSCYVEHEALLMQLHHLIANGLGDTEEADAVRDRMEPSWYRLKPEEKLRIEGLSADLYMLQDAEIFQPSDGRTKIQIGQAVYAAMEHERWADALVLLRQPNLLPREQVAAYRAAAYQGLGHLETALLFLRYVIQLDPTPPFLRVLELDLLARCRRDTELEKQAEAYLNDASAPAFLRINAAGILAEVYDHTESIRYENIVPALEQVLRAEAPTTSLRRDNMAFGYEVLAYCYFQLGYIQRAYDAVTEGLRLGSSDSLTSVQSNLRQMLAGDANAFTRYEQSMPHKLQTLRHSLSADTYALAAA